MRSLVEPLGLRNSSLHQIVGPSFSMPHRDKGSWGCSIVVSIQLG